MDIYAGGCLLAPEEAQGRNLAEEPGAIGFADDGERAAALERLMPPAAAANPLERGRTSHYESHTDFDYISLRIPSRDQPLAAPGWLEIFFTAKALLFVGGALPETRKLQAALGAWSGAPPAADRVLYLFFAELMQTDTEVLEDMEEEIAALEDNILKRSKDSPAESFIPLIGSLRKRLLVLKRYYEALWALLEDLEENQNGFIGKQQLRYFSFHTNRAERLARTVLNLRDYVTQVRESYQNQLDISLNQTMKLFTVITAVFLPLTLITGWFGMNLVMPETLLPITYPLVALFCLLVAGGCLWYFKRHKWY